jgi:hypothetical protein
MRNRPFRLAYGVMLMLGMAGAAVAQDNGAQQPSVRQQLPISIRRSRSTRNLLGLRKIWS